MLEQLDVLNADTQRSTFAAMSILSILFLLECISKWILWAFTGIFCVFALVLAYKLFVAPKRLKGGLNRK